jgi:hypothetical protein
MASEFVRRAAANVSNTLVQASNTVQSVAQGRKPHDISNNAVEKFNMTVKVSIYIL